MVDWIISKAGEEAPVVLNTLWGRFHGMEANRECADADTGHVASELERLPEPGPEPVS